MKKIRHEIFDVSLHDIRTLLMQRADNMARRKGCVRRKYHIIILFSRKKILNNSNNFGLITTSSAIIPVFGQNGLFGLILKKIFLCVKRGSE